MPEFAKLHLWLGETHLQWEAMVFHLVWIRPILYTQNKNVAFFMRALHYCADVSIYIVPWQN